MPTIRPFRALRYDPDAVGDVALVVSPPYDAISAPEQHDLLARHARNIVRLDLPLEEPGDEPDERYRRAARTYAAWRADGTLHRDRRPSVYACEQTYRVPGTDVERVQRGFFARLRLEAFGPGSTIVPLERTLSGPKEDRYRLLRASGANFSPVVGLYRDPSGVSTGLLEAIAGRSPDVEVSDHDGTRHRLWVVTDVAVDPESSQTDEPDAGAAAALVAAAESGPITLADGHHRYEAAVRYRDERRGSRRDGDEPYDYILAFLLPEEQPLTVLPAHRVLCDLGPDGVAALRDGLPSLFAMRSLDRSELLERFGAVGTEHGGGGRFGFWAAAAGALLEARRDAFVRLLPPGGDVLRRLDVTLLQVALDRLADVAPADVAPADAASGGVAAGRIAYTMSAEEAVAWVDGRVGGADAAFLLEPTPVADTSAVARAGDVMPQRSTYFYPTALSGLVVNPHEW